MAGITMRTETVAEAIRKLERQAARWEEVARSREERADGDELVRYDWVRIETLRYAAQWLRDELGLDG